MPEIVCTLCGKRYKVQDEVLGKLVRCSGCKSEFEAHQAASAMEMALMEPHRRLNQAIKCGSLSDLGFFLQHPFLMVNVDYDGGYQPLIIEMVVERKKYPALVMFTDQAAAKLFATHHPQYLDHDRSLRAFAIEGFEWVPHTSKHLSLLINTGSPQATLIRSEDWEPIRQAHKRFEQDPNLKKSIPKPNPKAGQQAQMSNAARNLRNQTYAYLDYMGFNCARWLPPPKMNARLRPTPEIAARLAALAGLFAWASAPREVLSSQEIGDFFKKNALGKYLTKDESAVIATPRTQALEEHQHHVGWRLENMWPLAWVLGYEPEPDIDGAQIDQNVSMGIIFEFLDNLSISLEDLLAKTRLRSLHEVVAIEDMFYCAHNAVRSAQTGQNTVPPGFDPIANGGVIHERRHSLTWCLSPGVKWQDTDLST